MKLWLALIATMIVISSCNSSPEALEFSTPQALMSQGTDLASSSVRRIKATCSITTNKGCYVNGDCPTGQTCSGTAGLLRNASVPAAGACGSASTADGPCCLMVHGYYERGDGGGGVFCYKDTHPTADNSGTVIASAIGPGKWVRYVQNPVDVRWFGARGDGTCCYDDEAINGALTSLAPRGGTVTIPPGTYKIDSSIKVTGEGVSLVGSGNNGGSAEKSTKVVWGGPQNATMLNVDDCIACRVADFSMNGRYDAITFAGIGINHVATTSGSQSCIFSNLTVSDIQGVPGEALHIGSPTHTVDKPVFENLTLAHAKFGLVQNGTQITNGSYRHILVQDATQVGMDFVTGDIHTDECNFAPYFGSGALADIRVRNTATWATFIGNYHETKSGVSYLFCPNTQSDCTNNTNNPRNYPTTLIGNRIQWEQTSGNIVDYQQNGALNLIGNVFETGNMPPAIYAGVVKVSPPAYPQSAFTNSGNMYTGNVTLAVSGNVFGMISNDPGSTPGSSWPATGATRFKDTELRLEGYSLLNFASSVTFGHLSPTATNGLFTYCSDCKAGAGQVCTGSGAGAFARRENGVWKCGM